MDEGLLEQHDRHAPYDDQQDVEPEALCSFEHQIRFAGRPAEQEARDRAALYNAAAALTLSVAVLFSYAVLFVLVLVAAGFFLESDFLQSNLGHPVGLADYVRLAWMATSLATVAGALGSGLEDEETVREATYGYRQQRRNAPGEPEDSSDS